MNDFFVFKGSFQKIHFKRTSFVTAHKRGPFLYPFIRDFPFRFPKRGRPFQIYSFF